MSAADVASRLDALTVDSVRSAGSLKWVADPEVIGAWIAEMDFGVAEPITAALHEVVDGARFGYTPAPVEADLGRAFAGFMSRRFGWEVDPGTVRPVADVLAGMAAVIDSYTTPGSAVIVPTPAYMPFLLLPDWHGRRIIQVPMAREGGEQGRYVYDLDALAAAFDDGGELLVLCNPHNPIGRVLTREELLAVADVVEAKGGKVFADEIHAPLVYPGHTHIPYASLDERTAAHTITGTSASKTFNLPGLKCAQLVFTNPDDLARWPREGRWVGQGASLPGLVANTVAFDAGEPWLDDILGYLDRNRRALTELLARHAPGVGYREPEGTYLALLDFRDTPLRDDPAAALRRDARIALTPGQACGDAGRGFARLNFATPRPILEQIVERIGTALAR